MLTLTDGTTLEVGIDAYSKAQCFRKREDIRSVVIPDGVKTIRKESFYCCRNLEEVHIPYGVTTIEPEAFGNCRSLKHIILPDTTKVISSRAFAGSGLGPVMSICLPPISYWVMTFTMNSTHLTTNTSLGTWPSVFTQFLD